MGAAVTVKAVWAECQQLWLNPAGVVLSLADALHPWLGLEAKGAGRLIILP